MSGYRQATAYVSRILHGARPGDLPVLLPGRFELVINTATAAKMGITIPRPLLLSASQLMR
jgi:putative tryptophan/tyrosine transport system substrate-binding protein